MLGDSLTVGRRVLAPLIQVRILVPQPSKIKGLQELVSYGPFLFGEPPNVLDDPIALTQRYF